MGSRQRWITGSIVLVCAAVTLAVVCGLRDHVTGAVPTLKRTTVLLDAGHGGFDGGAVAPDGTLEKDLNLQIALDLADWLRLCGYDVALTRTTDNALCEDETLSVRERKRQDMRTRLEQYEKADLIVAIHQNMFGVAKYHGAQVFYSPNNPLSKRLAEAVRSSIVAYLQPDNERAVKQGDKTIYLLYKTTRPTVLVECGFLSNTQELQHLKDPSYRRKLSFTLLCGVLSYTAPHAEGGG
ncbi:MAG: N-acetylmuramoyl-L-alanine amidase [Clostridia bacterium]|nr:N-acetylmuramoyl-L-alanine amidase [Clostridia bacterium]